MDLYIMNTNRETIGVIDDFESLIWTPRFTAAGDFEVYIRATPNALSLLQPGNYIYRLDDEMVGIIEKLQLTEDPENGDYFTVTGQDLKSLLGRRIVWERTILSGNAELAIRQLVNENIINPSRATRKIPGIMLGEIKGFSEEIDKQVTGDNLLDCINEICESFGYGYKITMGTNREFIFELYKGNNRSQTQSALPRVVFSYKFDNLSTSEYSWDQSKYRNVALVAGEGEGVSRKSTSVGDIEGIDRYEIYVDANDLSTDEGEIDATTYMVHLRQRGLEKLAENTVVETFNGEIIPGQTYVYKQDYFIGDIVSVVNKYGIAANVRITEVIENEDATGKKLIPTFENWEVA